MKFVEIQKISKRNFRKIPEENPEQKERKLNVTDSAECKKYRKEY